MKQFQTAAVWSSLSVAIVACLLAAYQRDQADDYCDRLRTTQGNRREQILVELQRRCGDDEFCFAGGEDVMRQLSRFDAEVLKVEGCS